MYDGLILLTIFTFKFFIVGNNEIKRDSHMIVFLIIIVLSLPDITRFIFMATVLCNVQIQDI